jgi:hypothetical protein
LLTTTERQIAVATILKLNGTSWEWDPATQLPADKATFAQLREDTMEEVDILDNVLDNDEPNAEGIYPDWATRLQAPRIQNCKIV